MRQIKFDTWVIWMHSENCLERDKYDQKTVPLKEYYTTNKKWLIEKYRQMIKESKNKKTLWTK